MAGTRGSARRAPGSRGGRRNLDLALGIARLARDPALFTRLLAVNNGTRPLSAFGVVNLLKLAVGSTPTNKPQRQVAGALRA